MNILRIDRLLTGCRRAEQYRLIGQTPTDSRPYDPVRIARQSAREAVKQIALREFFANRPELRPTPIENTSAKTIAPDLTFTTSVDAITRLPAGRLALTMATVRTPRNHRLVEQAGAEIASPGTATLAAAKMAIAMPKPGPLHLVSIDSQSLESVEEIIPTRRARELAEEALVSAMLTVSILKTKEIASPPYPKDSPICQKCDYATVCGNLSPARPEIQETPPEEKPAVTKAELDSAVLAYLDARTEAAKHEKQKKLAADTIRAALSSRPNRTYTTRTADGKQVTAAIQSHDRIRIDQKALRDAVDTKTRRRFTTVKRIDSLRINESAAQD